MPPLYPVAKDHPSVSRKYAGLADITPDGPTGDEQREAQNMAAEELLGLTEPAFTDAGAVARITKWVARQISFQLEQGMTPLLQKSTATNLNSSIIATTQHRDRYLDPTAAWGVAKELGVKQVRLTPRLRGTA
jgi:hypothetical protein